MKKYPLITRLLHWVTALLVIALFFSGWYMVQLDYYHPWYHKLPELHIVTGLLLALLWLLVLSRLFLPKVKFNQNHPFLERLLSQIVKWLFYLTVSIMVISGYLMSTASGEAFVLLNLIKIPAVSHFSAAQIDNLGLIHEYTSYTIMLLLGFHIIGAFKHHFFDKDNTLKHML
ncbi:MAG: cytochrome b [Xanthomonadales bacterium]|nr:cytochrome b [Xanthomonadales bacterium]